MKKNMFLLCFTLLLILLIQVDLLTAQPPPPTLVPSQAPLSGIEWLLISGGLYGFKKLFNKNSDSKMNSRD